MSEGHSECALQHRQLVDEFDGFDRMIVEPDLAGRRALASVDDRRVGDRSYARVRSVLPTGVDLLRRHTSKEVVLGCELQAGFRQNPARQSAIAAGIPKEVPATTINMLQRDRRSHERQRPSRWPPVDG